MRLLEVCQTTSRSLQLNNETRTELYISHFGVVYVYDTIVFIGLLYKVSGMWRLKRRLNFARKTQSFTSLIMNQGKLNFEGISIIDSD